MSLSSALPHAPAVPRSAAVPLLKKGPSRYFVSLPVDFLLIGGGSILLFLAMPLFQSGARTPQIIAIGTWLTWVGNWPHFSATSYRLYGARENLKQYPFTAVAAPLIVLAGALASFAAPTVVAPYFVMLLLLWSPFHYSGQTLGISLLYARRAGHRPERMERLFLTFFIYGTFLTRMLYFESSTAGSQYYGIAYPGFGVPRALATGASALTYACGAVFLLLIARTSWKTRKAPALMYLLPAATQYVWFFVAGAKPGFAELVPFFHGLQYLVIAWAMNLKSRADAQAAPATPRFALFESFRWYGLNIAGGIALFYVLPLIGADLTGTTKMFASAIVLGAVQIHHFFVDGVIWKLKSPAVSSPLLVNIPDLVRQADAPPAVPQGVLA